MSDHWHPSREPADQQPEGTEPEGTEEPTPAWGTAPSPVPGASDGPPTAPDPPDRHLPGDPSVTSPRR